MKSDPPLISVVIPIFNRSWQLRRALNSLTAQTFKNFEVIVCDDGSTEDISSVVQGYEGTLKIQLIRMPNWGGPARPRNQGMRVATGDWISFLDSDDWWDENRLEVMVNNLDGRSDFFYHSLRVVREYRWGNSREKRLILGEAISGDPFRQMMLIGNPIPTSATLIRRTLLLAHEGMSEERDLIAMEDFDCWLRLASAGARFVFLNQCLGNYWIGADAISNFTEKQIKGQKLLYQRAASKIQSSFLRQAMARQNYVLGSLYYRAAQPVLALKHLKQATPLSGFRLSSRRWGLLLCCAIDLIKNALRNLLKVN